MTLAFKIWFCFTDTFGFASFKTFESTSLHGRMGQELNWFVLALSLVVLDVLGCVGKLTILAFRIRFHFTDTFCLCLLRDV
jgi:hypothetical protein